MSMLSPKATRDGNRVRKRLQNEAQKAYDKFKLGEEQLEAEKLKLLSKTTKDDTSDQDDKTLFEARGLYFVDIQSIDAADGDESDSGISFVPVYFKNAFLNKIYKNFLSSDKSIKLSWKEFMCFTFCIQVPVGYLCRHVMLVQIWGAFLVLLVYITIGGTLSIPVYMAYMFLGNFTRRSYIRYWDCVPLLKGVAYSIALSTLYIETFNIGFAAIALYYICKLFSQQVPWFSCKFPRASNYCVTYNGSEYSGEYTATCCSALRDENCSELSLRRNVLKFSGYEYYNNYVLRRGYEEKPIDDRYLVPLAVNSTIIWILIFVLMLIGLRRIAKVMTTMNLIVYIILVPVAICSFILSPGHTIIDTMKTNFQSLSAYQFWIQSGIHILHRELPSDVLTFSSISKPGISTTVDTITIYTMKLFFTTTFTVWMSLSVSFLQKRYNVKDNKCIPASADALLFAVFPDIISRLPLPRICLILYFLIIFYWAVSTTTYLYNSFLEALNQEYPILVKWRFFICVVLCVAAGTGTIFLLTPKLMQHYTNMVADTIVDQKIMMLFVTLGGLFLYSLDRFKNDYHFYYGTILGSYWIIGIKALMMIIMLTTIAVIFLRITGPLNNYLIFSIVAAPTLIGMVIASIRYSLKISKTLISPNSRWGPPNKRQKVARIRFDPQHDLRYRSITHRCNHKCLLYSSTLKKEIKYWLGRRQQYLLQQSQVEEEGHLLEENYKDNKVDI